MNNFEGKFVNQPIDSDKSFEGKFVNQPIDGGKSWVCDMDLASLYMQPHALPNFSEIYEQVLADRKRAKDEGIVVVGDRQHIPINAFKLNPLSKEKPCMHCADVRL